MKIIVFAYENLSLTGGNLYDSLFYKTIKQDPFFNVEFCEPKIHKSGFALNKLITPFIELKWLNKIRKSDVVIWNSVDAYHCLLLIFCVRLFFPNKKTFVLHHHYKFLEMNGIKRKLFRFSELNFLRLSNSIIIPSPYILDQTKKYLPLSNITYLEIAFEGNKIAEHKQIKKGQMLFVGNIEPRKGLHLLLDSLIMLKSENNDFIINIVGLIIDENYYNKLFQKINEFGLENNVIFHGRVSDKEKANFMNFSDFFVFPSLLEGYGMVIAEAMSFGLPVVAFNNSAMPYTINDKYNGLLVENENVKDLKEKILHLINDSTLRKKLSDGAYETFSKRRKLPQLIDEIKFFIENLKS